QRRGGRDARVGTGDDLGSAAAQVSTTVDERPERVPEGRVRGRAGRSAVAALRRVRRRVVVARRGGERRGGGSRKTDCRDCDKAKLLQHVVHLLRIGYRGTRQFRPWSPRRGRSYRCSMSWPGRLLVRVGKIV